MWKDLSSINPPMNSTSVQSSVPMTKSRGILSASGEKSAMTEVIPKPYMGHTGPFR